MAAAAMAGCCWVARWYVVLKRAVELAEKVVLLRVAKSWGHRLVCTQVIHTGMHRCVYKGLAGKR